MTTVIESVRPAGPWQRVRAMWDEIKHRFAVARDDARVRADLEYELACLDRVGELDGSLENLGLSRAAIPFLIKNYPGSMRRYLGMTQRLGIAALAAPTVSAGMTVLFGPRRRCLFCTEVRRCERWQRTGGADRDRAFCPNAPVFDRMRKSV